MGSCLICGVSVEGRICDSHQEDVAFEFRGNSPQQLVPNRFYRGTVDGYAEFGVFIDLAPGVTGLLHRSELDRRLESLDWEPGDDVFVQVKGIRDNGNIDLAWSIRQAEREFRGLLIQDGDTDHDPEESDVDSESETETDSAADADSVTDTGSDDDITDADGTGTESTTGIDAADEFEYAESGSDQAERDDQGVPDEQESDDSTSTGHATVSAVDEDDDATAEDRSDESDATETRELVSVASLDEAVDESVRIEGEVVSIRQTGGPTIFEVRDETGIADAAAFIEAGVRAYPDVVVGDMIRLDGDVERRRGDIQVETEALAVLADEEAATVRQRLADALTAKARPDGLQPLAGDDAVAALADGLLDAAEAIRRAVLESRPIVVRHPATADGYVAGAAVERATLPLIREEHAKSDAEYHYFTRRPLENSVYGMDAATNDVTRMLQDRDRHDEKLPLFVLLGTGSTVESADGLGLLSVYDAEAVVVDAAVADPETRDSVATLVSPELANVDDDCSTTALVASMASAINDDIRADLVHLPAVSYWDGVPDQYLDLAHEAGYDRERVAELREAIALEAYYQSYQDKRELVADLLFEDGGDLVAHISEQYREKLEAELETATANTVTEAVGGVEFAVLDTDKFTHRYDFPPTPLLVDELHRRLQNGDPHATIGIGFDELYLRTTADVPIRGVATQAADTAPAADIDTAGVRDGKLSFLAGERDAVEDAVIAAVTDAF